MNEAFQIELLDQGWLNSSDPDDELCSHGHLRLVIGGQEVIGGEESYGISQSALAMLRTLAADHTREEPVAQQMVFHGCGTMLMMGCPVGADFSVHHRNGRVTIRDAVRYDTTNEAQATRFPSLEVELPEAEYRDQIVGFALRARELFAGTVKRVEDDFDAEQYRDFWAEFNKILGNHGHAALSLAVRGPDQMRYENRNLIDYGPLVVRTVSGRVVDADGLPIAGASVGVFTEPDHRLVTQTVSSEQGEFEVLGLQRGLYRVVVRSPRLCVANAKISVARWPRGGVLGSRRLRVALIAFRTDTRSSIEYR
jgi:hypothetical protein